MKSFSNIQGTLMEQDKELIHFTIERGYLKELTQTAATNDLPFELYITSDLPHLFRLFLDDRVVPSTRQGLTEELHRVGIPYYSPDALLRYNHGVSFEDDYWINFDDDKKTFEQVRFDKV